MNKNWSKIAEIQSVSERIRITLASARSPFFKGLLKKSGGKNLLTDKPAHENPFPLSLG